MSADAAPSETINPKSSEVSDICPICRMADNPKSANWVECDECNVWYHEICQGLTKVPDSESKFICNSCREKSK